MILNRLLFPFAPLAPPVSEFPASPTWNDGNPLKKRNQKKCFLGGRWRLSLHVTVECLCLYESLGSLGGRRVPKVAASSTTAHRHLIQVNVSLFWPLWQQVATFSLFGSSEKEVSYVTVTSWVSGEIFGGALSVCPQRVPKSDNQSRPSTSNHWLIYWLGDFYLRPVTYL